MKTSPLVIFGFDRACIEALIGWAEEGYLPTLASLMKRGFWGKTSGPELVCEYGVALSLFSGLSRAAHGYYYFRQLKRGTYELEPFSAERARAVPFWGRLRGRDKKAAILDADESILVKGIPGIQLLHWAGSDKMKKAFAEPPALLKEARRLFGPPLFVPEYVSSSTAEEDLEACRRFLERIERKGELCRSLLSRDRFDLVVLQFHEAHTGGHRLWKYRSAPQTLLREIYQAIDREIGLILSELPGEANVFILSSYGMEEQSPMRGLIESFCRRLGYQTDRPALPVSFQGSEVFGSFLAKTLRGRLNPRLFRRFEEALIAYRFHGRTDWKRTTAFAIPSLYTSFLFVNLRGREPEGIVEPGKKYARLLNQLESDLRQLVNPETGKPAVRKVTRTVESFCTSPDSGLPDLFVEWERSPHFVERLIHPRGELLQEKPAYCRENYHSPTGFVVGAGPAIRQRGNVGEIPLLDLAPTFLSLLGESVPKAMTGRVLTEGLTDAP
jgi:predicted AlkP superfamily phosphohydrolase/phosphomutase